MRWTSYPRNQNVRNNGKHDDEEGNNHQSGENGKNSDGPSTASDIDWECTLGWTSCCSLPKWMRDRKECNSGSAYGFGSSCGQHDHFRGSDNMRVNNYDERETYSDSDLVIQDERLHVCEDSLFVHMKRRVIIRWSRFNWRVMSWHLFPPSPSR